MEKIQPGSIGKINQATGGNDLSHFKMVENISKFLNAILAYGVPELDIFKADDLVDHRNIPAVTSTICALGRTVSDVQGGWVKFLRLLIPSTRFLRLNLQTYKHPEYKLKHFGPKPAEQNPRK